MESQLNNLTDSIAQRNKSNLPKKDIVKNLKKRIAKIKSNMDTNLALSRQLVILIGPARAGKSSLLNILARTPISIKRGIYGRYLHVDDPVSKIGPTIESVTEDPVFWYDEVSQILFVDCPGFYASNGAMQDIVNAFVIKHLFDCDLPKRVILTVPEILISTIDSLGFLPFLKKLTETIPNDQLQECLSWVITKQRDLMDPSAIFKSILALHSANDIVALTPSVKSLLRSYAADNWNDRIAFLPYPSSDTGTYECDEIVANIMEKINNSNSLTNITSAPFIEDSSKLLALELAKELDQDMIVSLKTVLLERIQAYLMQLINSCQNCNLLRLDIKRLMDQFFSGLDHIDHFGNKFDFLFDNEHRNVLITIIEDLKFLSTIHPTLQFNLSAWRENLPVKEMEKQLIQPKGELTLEGDITITGDIVSSTDLLEIIKNIMTEKINKISIQACTAVIFDSNIKINGVTLIIDSPSWNIIGNIEIDLTGTKGKDGIDGLSQQGDKGEDGRIGEEGGMGGNFYGLGMNFQKNLNNLHIITNGGTGGSGGKGGDGGNREFPSNLTGFDGGRGGLGGLGGQPGEVNINGIANDTLIQVISQNGGNGSAGSFGSRGKVTGWLEIWKYLDTAFWYNGVIAAGVRWNEVDTPVPRNPYTWDKWYPWGGHDVNHQHPRYTGSVCKIIVNELEENGTPLNMDSIIYEGNWENLEIKIETASVGDNFFPSKRDNTHTKIRGGGWF